MFFLIFLKPRKSFFSKAVNQIDYFLFFLEIILLIIPLVFSPFYPSLNYEKSFYISTLEKLGWQNGPLAITSHSPNFIIFCSSLFLFVVLIFVTLFRIKKTSSKGIAGSSTKIADACKIENLPGKLEDLFFSDSPISKDCLDEGHKIEFFLPLSRSMPSIIGKNRFVLELRVNMVLEKRLSIITSRQR